MRGYQKQNCQSRIISGVVGNATRPLYFHSDARRLEGTLGLISHNRFTRIEVSNSVRLEGGDYALFASRSARRRLRPAAAVQMGAFERRQPSAIRDGPRILRGPSAERHQRNRARRRYLRRMHALERLAPDRAVGSCGLACFGVNQTGDHMSPNRPVTTDARAVLRMGLRARAGYWNVRFHRKRGPQRNHR